MASPLEQFALTSSTILPASNLLLFTLLLALTSWISLYTALTASYSLMTLLSPRSASSLRSPQILSFLFTLRSATLQIASMAGLNGLTLTAYTPILYSLLALLLTLNLMGMLPYLFTLTAHIVLTLLISLVINLAILLRLLSRHGLLALNTFLPKDVPLAVLPLLILIESVSYVIKAITLAVRLFANITSGHILLTILLGFAYATLLTGTSIPLLLVALLILSLCIVLTLLELGVAIVQASVFTLLTSLYVADSDEPH